MLTLKLIQHIDDFVKLIADSMKQLFFNVYVSCNDSFLSFD